MPPKSVFLEVFHHLINLGCWSGASESVMQMAIPARFILDDPCQGVYLKYCFAPNSVLESCDDHTKEHWSLITVM